jgi:hypothetical protein
MPQHNSSVIFCATTPHCVAKPADAGASKRQQPLSLHAGRPHALPTCHNTTESSSSSVPPRPNVSSITQQQGPASASSCCHCTLGAPNSCIPFSATDSPAVSHNTAAGASKRQQPMSLHAGRPHALPACHNTTQSCHCLCHHALLCLKSPSSKLLQLHIQNHPQHRYKSL